jgi:peroxiredoxin
MQRLVCAILAASALSIGPKVGETVQDFSLSDQHGVTRTLRSTIGPKGAVLVFFRSADW